MDTEEIIELAKKSGAMFDHMTWVERDLFPVFERFAKLVAEKEREICADFVAGWTGPDGKHGCARALRGRSDGE